MSVLVGLVAALALTASGVTALLHAGQEVYAIPGWGVMLTVALMFIGLAGAALVAWSRQPAYAAGILAGTALGAFGLLAILSIGIFILAVAAGLLGWTLRRPWTGPRRGAAAAGAVLAGVALPVLLVLALSGPVVDCGPQGTSAGENLFMALGNDESEAESSDSPGGPETGRARGETYEYTFTCQDGQLTEFDFRRR